MRAALSLGLVAASSLAACMPDDGRPGATADDAGAHAGTVGSTGGRTATAGGGGRDESGGSTSSSGGSPSDSGGAGGSGDGGSDTSGGAPPGSGGALSSSGGATKGGGSSTGGTAPSSGGTAPSSGGNPSTGGNSATGGASNPGTGGRPSTPAGKVPVFVAVGHMGRTTVSCDDGKSWRFDRSLDDGARCFENGLDCDHGSGAGRGLDYGNGYFVAAFGWGEPGQLKRSRDGVNWEVAKDKTIFAGIAFGNGVFVANADRPLVSSDALTWHDAKGMLGLNVGNTRGIDFFTPGGGRFMVTGENDTTDLVQSKDNGETWAHIGAPPKECGVWTKNAAYNGSTVVLGAGKGWVCTSTDGGDSWKVVTLDADNLSANVIWTGKEFMTWNRSDVHRSTDGLTWTKQKVTPSTISIGPVARGPNGTFVAANDGWLVWYEKQQFFRSTDGVTWEVLDKSKFKGSHPIDFIRFGYADDSLACP